jgi:hypothetical protein
MTSKQNWICSICGQTFTRNTSGKRHNLNLHSGLSQIVYSTQYYVGIIKGKYQAPVNSPATFRRKKSFESNFLDMPVKKQGTNSNIFNPSDIKNISFYDIYNNTTIESKDEFSSNNFLLDNAAMIDSVIEEFQHKLQPFLSKEKINEFIRIILPLFLLINTKEQFYKYKRVLDNVSGFIRMHRRL